MMAVVELPEEINDHKNEWVALAGSTSEKLVGWGKRPEDAIAAAKTQGYGIMDVTLLWVPDRWPGVPGLGL